MATEPTVSRPSDLVTIIDPNPVGHVIEHEDLYIYASLVAKTKGRTFLTEKADGSIDTDSLDVTTVDLIVSDTGARKEDKRKYLSTNWTTIGGSQIAGTDVVNNGDLEGFGITNVEIKMEGSYIPTVVIDFVDIRGATLFEQGSCSPYGLFFHLPYPIFELTVKGYYGKPATYYLNLVKFNTKFNAETGNFECRGEFIGWSYAFLADILMGYVRCSNYMTQQWGAKESLRKKYDEAIEYYWDNGLYDASDYISVGNTDAVYLQSDEDILQPFCSEVGGGKVECYTISDLIWKIKDIKFFLGQVKTDDQYVELGNLVTLRNIVLDMRSELQRLIRIIEEEHTNSYTEIKRSTAPTITTRSKYVFSGPPDDALKTQLKSFLARPTTGAGDNEGLFGQITAVIPRAKTFLITKDDVFPKRCGGSYISLGSNLGNGNNGLTGCNDILDDNHKYNMFDLFDQNPATQKFQNGMLETVTEAINYPTSNSDGDPYYIDFGYIETIIDEALGTIDSDLESRRNKIKEELDAGIIKILGFRPTIRNIFTILTCNVENFVQLLLECSIKAEQHHQVNQQELFDAFTNSNNDRLLELKNASPGQSLNEQPPVFSWPTYYQEKYNTLASYSSNNKKETKEVFPGENPDFYNWPEVRFVEDFIKACEKLNKEDEALQEDLSGVNGFDNYTPINPLESKLYGDIGIKYLDAVNTTEIGDTDERVMEIMAQRMFVSLDFSYYDPIRLNKFNIGMGHTIPQQNKSNAGIESNESFQERRLWFHPQYRETNIIKNLAKIDAHNLLSCVDDPSQLANIDITIFQGSKESIIENMANRLRVLTQTDGGSDRTEPNSDQPEQSWFNSNRIPEYSTGNIDARAPFKFAFDTENNVVTNGKNILNLVKGYKTDSSSLASDYWAYHPEQGKIPFVARRTRGGLGNVREVDTAIFIHSDIAKMKQEHLFQLLTKDEYVELQEGNVKINYDDDDIKKRKIELNKDYVDSIGKAFKDGCSANAILPDQDDGSGIYTIDADTKLPVFQGDQPANISLFIGLDAGYSHGFDKERFANGCGAVAGGDCGGSAGDGSNFKYEVETYWGAPVYLCSSTDEIAGSYMSSWDFVTGQETYSMQFPFVQAAYLQAGDGTPRDAYGNPGKIAVSGKIDITRLFTSLLPYSFPLELPGMGVLEGFEYREVDTGRRDGGNDNPKVGPVSDSNIERFYDLVNGTTRIINRELFPGGFGDDNTIPLWTEQCSEDEESDYTYNNTWQFDTFVMTPLWLDNVNYFRKAVANNKSSGNSYPTRNTNNYNWGGDDYEGNNQPNPLSTNNYELTSPTIRQIKSAYGEAFDKQNPETPNNGNNDAYTGDQIQNRNLAYLFLAGLKTTPLITCGTKTSQNAAPTVGGVQVGWTEQGNYNYVSEHYPKAIQPFIKSQGLAKLPRAWVYGMGSVLWRWKCFMGQVGLTANGDIITGKYTLKHPFKQSSILSAGGQVAQGTDPLAQPGHPSRTDLNGGYSFDGAGMMGEAGRKDRSWCVDVGNGDGSPGQQSYTNKIFRFESGLWQSDIKTNLYIQNSAFGWGTTNQLGWKRALTKGNANENTPYNSLTWYNPIKGESDDANNSVRLCAGYMFDYWGVYNGDSLLSKRTPSAFKWNKLAANGYKAGPLYQRRYHFDEKTRYARGVTLIDYPDWINDLGKPDETVPGFSSWFRIYTQNAPSLTPTSPNFFGETAQPILENNPSNLAPRNAREAAMNSFNPFLWATPWQHFYTETLNSEGKFGPRLNNENEQSNNFCENRLTFIPADHQFRDYVGNFGLLGDTNNNYANYDLKSPGTETERYTIPENWNSISEIGEPYKDYSGDGVNQFQPSLWTTRFTKGDVYGINNWFNLDGGKYAELIGLPNFVLERFIEEFEKWVDYEFKSEWLPVIDPVNFQTEDGLDNPGLPGAKMNLLGRSYRMKGTDVFGEGWVKYLGYQSADNWEEAYNSTGFPSGILGELSVQEPHLGLITLSKDSKNGAKIGKMRDELINEHYYAIIPTPRLFGLDISSSRYYENASKEEVLKQRTRQVPFVAKKSMIDIYVEAFREEWRSDDGYKEYYKLLSSEGANSNDSILDDSDVKLALYRSFKSINDKWISSTQEPKSGQPKYFFNITDNELGEERTPLAGHFSYVNRVMGEVGNQAVLDVIKLEKVKDNPKMSFYNLISDLLGENKFDFFPLPTFTNFTTPGNLSDPNKVAKDMFSPYTNRIEKASGPNFICMYVGGTSRTLDLKPKPNCPVDEGDMNYNDDGMSMGQEDFDSGSISYEFQDERTPLVSDNRFQKRNEDKRIENNGITAFRVAYGIENQNMFKSVELDQTEFSETNESLMVIDRLATGGNPANRTQKGNNLHNVYLTRSYTCKVSSMGNMMIQPLQYFDLTNIPMFYGTYLITKVEHTIKPHHIDTNFTGVRQPIATVPVVEDIAIALNESIADIEPIEGPNVLTSGNVTGSGNPNNSGGGYNTSTTSSVSVAGVNYIDIGATDPTQYYNRRFKWCNSCSSKGDTSKGRWGGRNQGTASNPRYTRWIDESTPMKDFDINELEYITLHWTAGFQDTADSNTHWQNGTHYHFEIDKDGTLNKISDTTKVGIHAGNINDYSIGISYVGGVENGDLNKGYVRTVDDWNSENLNLNGTTSFNAKKQFAAIFQAIVLSVQQHPQIKYLTSHHFVSTSKVDVGDKFPYNILISKLKEVGIDLELKYSGTAPRGVSWSGDAPVSVSGDIDLSFIQTAQEQELSGNSGAVSTPNPNSYDPNQAVGQGVTPPTATSNGGSAVQNALNSAGQI